MTHDLIIEGAMVATAADVMRADIGIRDGKVATLGRDLGPAARTIDASGLYALPGGIDSHVHISQPSGPSVVMADDFESATRAAAIGGNTTVLPFCLPEDDLDRSGFEGAKYVCSPPPRDAANQAACWDGVLRGDFELFSSDHCPFLFASPQGKQTAGAEASFRNIPNGIPGVETRLPILFSEGVSKGRLELSRFVAITATNHAKLYGLYPQKGTIAVGSDADIVLWDPTLRETIRQEILHHGSDYTPWEGFEVTGWPVTTILRGRVVVENRVMVDGGHHGGHLSRALPGRPF